MEWRQFFQKLYSLETLDTRFVVPSNVPLRQALENSAPRQPLSNARPSLWKTPEYLFYYVCFVFIVPQMVKAPMDVSKPSHPNYGKFVGLLEDGWIPGRKVDNSDNQYSSFRDNLPYLFLLLILHPLLRRGYDYIFRRDIYTKVSTSASRPNGLTQGLPPSVAADARHQQRATFDRYFGVVFITALHGFSALKILLILYTNYRIAKSLPRKYVPAATWVFNVGILFANEFGRGYPFASIASYFSFSDAKSNWGSWMDKHGGLIPRWEVLFKITILRLISFNMDYYWSFNSGGSSPVEKNIDPSDLSERDRVDIPAKPQDYSFPNYLSYTLYAPLYLAGPILTFNDYTSQLRHKLPSITRERTLLYAIRFVIVLLTMELLIHYIYAVAIAKSQPDWRSYTPFQLSMLGYFNLHHIWLKLLIPWRLFRLWALVDGIDPPENMARCMSNNYSALAFWRAWHRSYNRWLVRYIFVPLGGSGARGSGSGSAKGWRGSARTLANLALVFMFVAVWHDIDLRLLMWGWLVTLFVIPETVAMYMFPASKYRERPNEYRWLCGVGAFCNQLLMMVANLVGYALGVEGLKGLLLGIVGSKSGVALFGMICGSLFVGTQVMFEVREEERRNGIRMKC